MSNSTKQHNRISIFLITCSFVFFAVEFFIPTSIDLHLHATYYVVSAGYVAAFLSSFPIAVAIAYRFTGKWLHSTALSWVHSFITAIALLSIMIIGYYQHYAYHGLDTFDNITIGEKLMHLSAAAILLSFLLYPVNLIWGAVKGRAK